MRDEPCQRVVVVLGMHRSGTSVLTRGLRAMNVDLGEHLLAAEDDNTLGFWEDVDLTSVNEQVLGVLGLRWHSVSLIEPASWELPALGPLKIEAAELIRRRFGASPLWGFKDPRTVRLLPFWRAVFSQLGVDDSYVIALRNPVSVARSLATRNGMTSEHSHLLWLQHVLAGFLNTCDKTRVVVDYDRLIDRPAFEVRRMARALDIELDETAGREVEGYERDFVSESLRHTRFQVEDARLDPSISELAWTTYELIAPLASNDGEALQAAELGDLGRRLKTVDQRLRALTPLFRELDRMEGAVSASRTRLALREKEVASLGGQLSELQGNVSDRDQQIDYLRADLTGRDRQIVRLRGELASRDGQISQLEKELSGRDRRIVDLQSEIVDWEARLQDRSAELDAERQRTGDVEREAQQLRINIHMIMSSWSMQLTRPLRWGWDHAAHLLLLLRRGARRIREQGGGVKGVGRVAREAVSRLLRKGPHRRVAAVPPSSRSPGEARPFLPASASMEETSLQPVNDQVEAHSELTDVVVCVHDALDHVKRCLSSVLRHSLSDFRLIVVDDGSSDETRDFLRHFAQSQGALLIRNPSPRGYTCAANQGLHASTAAYVVLLNSDTVVTPDWLSRMLTCAKSDVRIGVVGPLSNTASWQSIPRIREVGDWAENPLPVGMTADQMGRLVAAWSGRLYPRIPFINGFCLMIARRLIEDIGYFDEATFGEGYGEENDYCLRAGSAGWKTVVADDAYVYHAQSRSYSDARRKALSKRADVALRDKYSGPAISEGVEVCLNDPVMVGLRARAAFLFERQATIERSRSLWEGKRIAFVLPSIRTGGGANVVISEVRAMRRMGVDARIINLQESRSAFEASYPNLDVPMLYAERIEAIPEACTGFDAVVATAWFTMGWIRVLAEQSRPPTIGYYVQDYEPYFYSEGSQEREDATDSYCLVPDMVLVTKTDWNRQRVLEETGAHCELIGPSFETDLFRPRRGRVASQPSVVQIAAMVRPETPRRNAAGTMRILREVTRRYGMKVEVKIFGADPTDEEFLPLPKDFPFRSLGRLSPTATGALLNDSDVFVDFSIFQAMGLTAMEAMACGVAVVVPEEGGARSFAKHEENALVVDTGCPKTCQEALSRLIEEPELRLKLQQGGIQDIAEFYPEGPASRTLAALFGQDASLLVEQRVDAEIA